MHAHDSSLLVLLILLPLAGAIFNGLLGKKLKDQVVHTFACAAVGVPALLAWFLFFQLLGLEGHGRALHQVLFPWIHVGEFQINFGLLDRVVQYARESRVPCGPRHGFAEEGAIVQPLGCLGQEATHC